MKISVEDSRTGKLIKLDVKEHHVIEKIVDIIIKHMGIISVEQRSYTLVLNGQELPPNITVADAVHKFGLKENDKLALWARVIGGKIE
ncbi:MAG: hypothetical protein EU539_08850 [Promethearchaeota archaeon]|nr:MAG: hypothetical protein EU539_08850 [Candidatus Lokiarchaeota archaeon]